METIKNLVQIRWSMAAFFFAMGFTFASWASRIPDIKAKLSLTEAELGTLLFVIPVGQLCAMPFSGKLVSKYGSKSTTYLFLNLYAMCLIAIGLSDTKWQLAIVLFFFGLLSNLCNIAINTQGVITQDLFDKPIMGSFHGSWSLAGFTAALMGLFVIGMNISPMYHFMITFGFVALLSTILQKKLVDGTNHHEERKVTISFLSALKNKTLLWLGFICFCCMASEGIMFDWSGVYFKEVVKAPKSLVILGYTAFMISMATGRFLSDILVKKYGNQKVLILSGILISSGLYTAVFFPELLTATIAFILVGFGVSNVVPIVYSGAGKTEGVSASIGLTVVTSISFFGFLMGPPVIGWIAEWTNLRVSFALIGIFGILIAAIVGILKPLRN